MQFIQSDRGMGKTYTAMSLIQEFIVSGAGGPTEVCVVVPDHRQIFFWTREWQSRFPGLAVPQILSIQSADRVRGKRFKFLVVEDVDILDDGWNDERLHSFFHTVLTDDVLFTASNIPSNQKPYTTITTMDKYLRDKIRTIRQRRKRERALQDSLGIAAILARLISDTDDKDLIDAVLSGTISPLAAVDLAYDSDGNLRTKNH